MDKIRVLIADDHAIVRIGLVALLETDSDIEVVGEADDGEVAVRKALKLKPDVVVMDLMMPVLDGIAATRELRERLPSAKVLALTTSSVSDDLQHAIDAGASGVVTKSSVGTRLLSAIKSVAVGRKTVAPEVSKLLSVDPPVQPLTPRQAEVLGFLVRGLTNSDIARQLGISVERVKDHLNAIFAKIGAANRVEAVAIALRKHLV